MSSEKKNSGSIGIHDINVSYILAFLVFTKLFHLTLLIVLFSPPPNFSLYSVHMITVLFYIVVWYYYFI